MSDTEFRACENPVCGWHGLAAECFIPHISPQIPLCSECGSPTSVARPLTQQETTLAYCVQGYGYSGQYSCLKEACTIVQKNKQGAVYQRLWDYEPYLAGPSLAAEIRCDCARCLR